MATGEMAEHRRRDACDVGQPLRLETLACDRNKLQQVLDLSRNQLSFLPGDFCWGARQLRYLDLSQNQRLDWALERSCAIVGALILWGTLVELKGLRKLMASYNNLTALPESIGECSLLEKIRVETHELARASVASLDLPPGEWMVTRDRFGRPRGSSHNVRESTMSAFGVEERVGSEGASHPALPGTGFRRFCPKDFRLEDLELEVVQVIDESGSKPAFTSIHALWDKFEVGETLGVTKGYMTKDEWFNLCTRVQTKLPKHVQLDLWNFLAWRDKVRGRWCGWGQVPQGLVENGGSPRVGCDGQW
eukprot:Skav219538  [mRNA]  locus=scaffold30:856213:893057:- [translate_table: standard]